MRGKPPSQKLPFKWTRAPLVNIPSTRSSQHTTIASVSASSFIISSCRIDNIDSTIINDTAAGISLLPSLGRILQKTQQKISPCYTIGAPFNGGPPTIITKEIIMAFEDSKSGAKKYITFKILPDHKDIYGYDALLGKNALEEISTCIQLSKRFPTKVVYNIPQPILSCQDSKRIETIIEEFDDIFCESPTAVNFDTVRIPTFSKYPIAAKLKQYNLEETKEISKIVERLQRRGFIEPCMSPWAANCRAIPKKNGDTRLVINYIPLIQLQSL